MKPAVPQQVLHRLHDLATRLPWWGGLLSALAAYSLLHPIALLQVPAPAGTVDVIASALAELLILLAALGQYLLPLAFLIATAVSGFERWRRVELRYSVRQDTSGSILRGLPRRDFELLVGDAFRRQGYVVWIPQKDSWAHDGLIELSRDGRRFLVDCTDWRSWKAGAGALRALRERIEETGAAGGFAVTSGLFRPEAKHFAADADIQLIDGQRLKEMVGTQDQSAHGDSSSMGADPGTMLSRWSKLIPAGLDRSKPMPQRDPGMAHSAAEAPNADSRDIPLYAPGSTSAAEDAVTAAGQELAALIRAERRIEGEIELSAPPVRAGDAGRPRPRAARPRFRGRSVADAAGMLLTLGVLWGIYDWYLGLPDEPADTPWALLGAGSDSDALKRRLQGLTRTQTAAKLLEGKRALGRYQFGPPQGYLTRAALQPAPVEEEPVEVYHSLRELEMAFEAKYVPPPDCYAYESGNQMVRCGNHRIRARRSFVASGGEVTPILLGSWEDPQQILPQAGSSDWRQYDGYDEQQDSPGEWEHDWQSDMTGERGQEWARDWAQESATASDPDWRREEIPRQAEDWRQVQPQDPEEDWSRDWRSEPAPIEGRHWVDDL